MPFQPGKSGNPLGKPKGTRNKFSRLLEPYAPQLIEKAVELALTQNDVGALKICIERILPKAKNEAVELVLPTEHLTSSESLLKLGEYIIKAVAAGDITLEEAHHLSSLIEAQGKSIYLANLEGKVMEIDRLLKKRTNNN